MTHDAFFLEQWRDVTAVADRCIRALVGGWRQRTAVHAVLAVFDGGTRCQHLHAGSGLLRAAAVHDLPPLRVDDEHLAAECKVERLTDQPGFVVKNGARDPLGRGISGECAARIGRIAVQHEERYAAVRVRGAQALERSDCVRHLRAVVDLGHDDDGRRGLVVVQLVRAAEMVEEHKIVHALALRGVCRADRQEEQK